MDSKTLLEETKIGEGISIEAVMDDDEVGLLIASVDVSASCAFSHEEWEVFVECVNQANEEFLRSRII
jgi:hypothetical protein